MSQKNTTVTQDDQGPKASLSNRPSFTNLYNSNSQKGSNLTLMTSNSAVVINNGTGLVHKGFAIQKRNNILNNDNHFNNNNDSDTDNDSVLELNWIPQVSSDDYTCGYYDKI